MIAQAQISGLEQRLQELTDAHKQVGTLHMAPCRRPLGAHILACNGQDIGFVSAEHPSCAVQGVVASEGRSSDELVKLRQELEASRAEADGYQHALQELSAQAKACSSPIAGQQSA